MSTTITGLGSGFDIDSWVSQLVSARKSSTVTPLQTKLNSLQTTNSAVSSLKTKFQALQSSLQKFSQTMYDTSSDMWQNTTIKSSNDAYAVATSSGSVSASNVELEIEQIATATVAKSFNSLAMDKDLTSLKFTSLANGQAQAGSFSMVLNGRAYNIDIEEDDTLGSVMEKIKEKSDNRIQADITNGKFSIKAYDYNEETGNWEVDTTAKLTLGTSADTSNILTAFKLYNKIGSGYGFESKYPLSAIDTDKAMASSESGLGLINLDKVDEEGNKYGIIKINGVEFKVDEKTSLNNLISKINSNSDVKVKASYDALENKFILTASQTGASNIALSSDGTDLLNVLGLTEGIGEAEKIIDGTQELGQNAMVKINGNDVISTSNTIKGESSGIANLSITIKKPTSGATGNKDDDEKVTLDISRDYSAVKNALNDFVSKYNDVITTTKTLTASDGAIAHDSTLNSILSNLKSSISSISSNDGSLSMLSQIGISTSKGDITQLSIDSSKLDKALEENLDSVKLLLSDGYTSKKDNGVFDKMLNNINSILDSQTGYFANKTTSLDSQIKSMNSRIDRANTLLNNYEARITKQFNQMDSVMSSLSAQLTTFQAYIR